MNVLGIDFECSGLDPTNDRIIEVGAVLWDWDNATPLRMLSEIVDPGMDLGCTFELSEEIVRITGITADVLSKYGVYQQDVFDQIRNLAQHAEYFMAHFGNSYDRLFFDEAIRRHGYPSVGLEHQWLDTNCDIKWPPHIKTRNLRHLASEHDFLNPFTHRAVFDVLTMFKVASQYRIEDIIARSHEPMVYLEALVSFDDKEKAKARGYHWNPGMKVWWKEFKSSDSFEELKECGFKTGVLAEKPKE